MSGTSNNQGALGLILLLLILGGQSGSRSSGWSGIPGGLGNLSDLGKTLQLEHFARDMHRVVAMMDQVEGLTQMVGMGQLASSIPVQEKSRTASPQARVTGAADSVSNAFADAFGSLNVQDMGQLMEMAGPLMAMFGKNANK